MSANRSIRNSRKKFSETEMRIMQDIITMLSMKRRPDSEIAKEIYKQINKSVTRRDISYVREQIIKENVEEIKLIWKGISKSEEVNIRRQLMAYQRIKNIGDDTAPRKVLLSEGYDSAITITDKNKDRFSQKGYDRDHLIKDLQRMLEEHQREVQVFTKMSKNFHDTLFAIIQNLRAG